jgi:hypothetical protein
VSLTRLLDAAVSVRAAINRSLEIAPASRDRSGSCDWHLN